MEPKTIFKEGIFRFGLALLSASFALFVLVDLLPNLREEQGIGWFMLHYAFTVTFFFTVLFSGRFKRGRNGLPLVIINLLLFLISAFALNREMDVFNQSVLWMQIFLVVTGIHLLTASLAFPLPQSLNKAQAILLTVTAVFYTYLSVYLLPLYAFGVLGTLAIGIGMHSFVPMLLLIYTLKILRSKMADIPGLKIPVFATLLSVLLLFSGYTVYWHQAKGKIETIFLSATTPGKIAWPAWVETLEKTPDHFMVSRILKAGIVYKEVDLSDDFSFFNPPSMGWDETKKHDPFVVIASLFSGPVSIPQPDRIQMLQAMQDKRYAAEERLWSGNDLQTLHLNSEVQIWPSMHLAYTEKTITVANRSAAQRWNGQQQEAIYIFQLPEGGVVTSLSLWIEGLEVKSVLTSKGKATEAYKTIVGREARDPSVVHWQEGNRVSVRVFPVMAGDQRIFKIGITAPMPVREGKIWYEQVAFEGPSPEKASEKIHIQLMEPIGMNYETVALVQQDGKHFEYKGRYNPDLSISFPAEAVKPQTYVREGVGFQVASYTEQLTSKTFTTVYADLNTAWSNSEWEMLLQQCKGKKCIIYDDRWIEVTAANQEAIFEKLSKRPVTLFPFYAVRRPEQTLIVTKSAGKTPNLTQLKRSSGWLSLTQQAEKGLRYAVYHIGEKPSLYLRSLRELRLFHYAQGTQEKLNGYLQEAAFVADTETENQVVLYDAGLKITKLNEQVASDAPNHILRLFAYNHLMQQGGLTLLAGNKLEEGSLYDLASYAHIVTPVSSMVVLESQKDYDRFDIKGNEDGLQNATIQNTGSVPEPHEWILMILGLLLLAFYMYAEKLKTRLLWLKK